MVSDWLYVEAAPNCSLNDFEEQVNDELRRLQADGHLIKDVKYGMATARYDSEMYSYSALILYH